MTKTLGVFTAAAAALALLSQPAAAGPYGPYDHGVGPEVAAVGVAAAAGTTVGFLSMNNWKLKGPAIARQSNGLTTGGAYAASAVGCMAVSPIVATIVARRELTFREAHVLAGNCVLPIIGGLLVNAAYNANPHWEPAPKKPARKRVVRRARR